MGEWKFVRKMGGWIKPLLIFFSLTACPPRGMNFPSACLPLFSCLFRPLCETCLCSCLFRAHRHPHVNQPNQEFIMGKGNNSQKKEVKKPKKEKPKVLATRKTN
jgi:hypothetical protein